MLENQRYLLSEVTMPYLRISQCSSGNGYAQWKCPRFLMSEFGRTLNSTSNGTDHACRGNVFAMVGKVNGNRFDGDYPILTIRL
ncbi:MAG: DUF1501 domain-containing protein [Saprospiraceae bacterium]|nr:DUF1501 domain-containing protein [Saprospiraceae bacterium]